MNAEKTGKLISDARKEKGLTQRELADLLHVSNRAVSNWETGARFPDVALLESLADALDLSVTGLLQGERVVDAAAEPTVREAVSFLYTQTKRGLRQHIGTMISALITMAALALILFLFGILPLRFKKDVALEVPATVYRDGQPISDTTIIIDGELTRTLTPDNEATFNGRFHVAHIPAAGDDILAEISWNHVHKGFQLIRFYNDWHLSIDTGIGGGLYISRDMRCIGLKMEDGTVIASDETLAKLLELDYFTTYFD